VKRSLALALAGGLATHAVPALASIGPLRNRFTPTLAGTGDPGHVALTFDDGPHPDSTPKFLVELDRLGVRATFFLTGRWAARCPGLAAELVAAGHEVAVHGYGHRSLLLRGPRGTYEDLARGRDAVASACGVEPEWYRPPYGVLTGAGLAVAKRLGLRTVLWTAWGEDWAAGMTAQSVTRTVLADLTGGGTVLLHDSDATSVPGSWRATLGAVPAIVEILCERGLRVGPLAEHGVPSGS